MGKIIGEVSNPRRLLHDGWREVTDPNALTVVTDAQKGVISFSGGCATSKMFSTQVVKTYTYGASRR